MSVLPPVTLKAGEMNPLKATSVRPKGPLLVTKKAEAVSGVSSEGLNVRFCARKGPVQSPPEPPSSMVAPAAVWGP